MTDDKYSALWLSHSSISDFLNCPRSYYLKNVYKDPKTGRKVQIVNPALSLGSAVHQIIESLSILPVTQRFKIPLTEKFKQIWYKYEGLKGGFTDPLVESDHFQKGLKMLDMVERHPGPLEKLAVKIKADNDLPWFYLSKTDNIILCGKIDWLEYLKTNNSVHIIDFKTSRKEEKPDSLQLPIYQLLALNCQDRPVFKASYWYLDKGPKLSVQKLADPDDSQKNILKIAKKIKLTRQLNHFKCPKGEGGCFYCRPFEDIINNIAKFVGTGDFRDNYITELSTTTDVLRQSIVL